MEKTTKEHSLARRMMPNAPAMGIRAKITLGFAAVLVVLLGSLGRQPMECR